MRKPVERSIAVGDLFSFPLKDGELGLCLVGALGQAWALARRGLRVDRR